MEINAITILYHGSKPTKAQLRELASAMSFAEANTEVTTHVHTAKEIAETLFASKVKTTVFHDQSDIESAVIFLSGKISDLKSIKELALRTIKNLNSFYRCMTDDNEAYVKACSIISNANPKIVLECGKKYGFGETARDVIVNLYDSWKNGENV
jgi:hypothetical protein